MKVKIYTQSHDPTLLTALGESGRPFSAQEHAFLSEREWGERLSDRDVAVRFYRSENEQKLPSVAFLVEQARKRGWRHLLSLGAGLGVLEHLAAQNLGPEQKITISDFDSFMVKRARALFPELGAVRFDFFHDDAAALIAGLDRPVDAAVFFGSSYVMDDPEFLSLGRRLFGAGVTHIIDFNAALLGWRKLLLEAGPVGVVRRHPSLRRLLGKGHVGKFHGYSRSRRGLRALYGACGYHPVLETRVPGYAYVLVLEKGGPA